MVLFWESLWQRFPLTHRAARSPPPSWCHGCTSYSSLRVRRPTGHLTLKISWCQRPPLLSSTSRAAVDPAARRCPFPHSESDSKIVQGTFAGLLKEVTLAAYLSRSESHGLLGLVHSGKKGTPQSYRGIDALEASLIKAKG